jgi:hypothetical protein
MLLTSSDDLLPKDLLLASDATVMIVGLKHDLEHKVNREDVLELAKKYDCVYHELSLYSDSQQEVFRKYFENILLHQAQLMMPQGNQGLLPPACSK